MHIAEQQHGVITSSQLLQLGYSKDKIYQSTKAGLLIRVTPRVYRIAGAPLSRKQNFMTVVLGYKHSVWISHFAAAELHNLKLWQVEWVDVVTERGKHPHAHRRSDVVIHTCPAMFRADCTTVENIPVTSVGRTIVDLAQYLNEFQLGITLDDALQRKLVTLREVQRTYDRVGHWAGRKRFRAVKAVLAERIDTDKVESALEREVLAQLRNSKMPKPIPQYKIRANGKSYRLDFAYPELRVGIEVDGFTYHRERINFDRDRQRDNDLRQIGWTIIHFTSNSTPPDISAQVAFIRTMREETRLVKG